MASFTGKIYLTTNLINGKFYIGQTKTTGNSYLGSGTYLKKAIEKHGKKNFSRVILRDNILNMKELDFWEDFYIKIFDSQNKKYGYNKRPGGKEGGWFHTDEAKAKIINRSNQEDNKIRIREIQKMAASTRIGMKHTKEAKLKMVKTKFGNIRIIEIYTKDGKLFDTCNLSTEAAELTGVKRSNIANNLYGITRSAGGYIFTYKNII